MFSLHRQDALRKASIIKSNLLSSSAIDVDSLVKCIQVEKGNEKDTKDIVKSRITRNYFHNKYKTVQHATRIKFNQLSQKEILIPDQVQVQAHIVNVSFGVVKKKKTVLKLATSVQRPSTSSTLKRNEQKHCYTLSDQIKSTDIKHKRGQSPTKSRLETVQFSNEHIATITPNLKFNYRSNTKQSEQQPYRRALIQHARSPASLDGKNVNTLQQLPCRRKHMKTKDHFIFGLDGKRNSGQNKIQQFRDFLWKVNFSNGLYVDAELQLKKPYSIYVGAGNNSVLIRSLMKRRFWWNIVDKISDDVNFVWTQLKVPNIFKAQLHFCIVDDSNQEIDNILFTNVSTSDTKFGSVGSVKQPKEVSNLAHKKIFSGSDLQLWNGYFRKNTKIESTLTNKTYLKRFALLKKKKIISIQKTQNLIVHNHFQSNFFIGNKKAMFYNMKLYYSLQNEDVFNNLPMTFHIIKGVEDPEYKKFLEVYNNLQKQKCKLGKNFRNIWIMKPGEFTNRGKGITVCSSLEDIVVRLKGKEKNADKSIRTFILQKYIQKPFLYYKRKFDIRHYMMITCINKKIKGYWYEEGYIRTTSTEYNIKNCKDNYIHLTNDAVQKTSEDYGRFEKGNKLSYQDFQKYLDTYHEGQYNFFSMVLPQMKRIAADSIKASYTLLDMERLEHNFEIFGLDFMIDYQFKTSLIEINTNPCLQLSSPLLARIIPSMVSNALMIGLDPLFPPPYNWPSNKKYQLSDSPLDLNKFQLIFDQNVHGPELVYLYSNIKKIDQRMGNIDEEEQQYGEESGEFEEDFG